MSSSHLQIDSGVVVCVDGLAEVDGVSQFLFQHWLAGVARNFEQKETRVGLGEIVVRGLVFVQHLWGGREGEGMGEGERGRGVKQ